ncbi:phosphate signaling complex protein PhoU [Gallaecimonas pentaromativorans]|uniref:Phosphate-specific transport system accessory protein PhoU n=1 Tax=Gallaecimonas pentaromativorans TaxID=584787 RepID=A0A3N1PKM9_9GAMM|nr:phosphate signaling complex protein PhoU [Gallaecimonas pentaromativorans]MED5524689.1 phosphate signaling complex protein PhoU [Pseudomonadota bacterium]ROQ28679.1 PhoU-like phosphate uptake regulator [Gallaecimonas pentaromativorans]
MDNMNLSRHISGQFNQELEHVRNMVLTMGGLVEKQLDDAIRAVHDRDGNLAEKVVEGDRQVNAMEVAIDEECTRIIAKRQPAASDLRLVIAIIKTIADLERIGDTAERIAKIALGSYESSHMTLLVSLESMAHHVLKMVRDTLDAFARMDVDAALTLHAEDARVDREYESLFRELMTYMMEDPRSIPKVIEVMWAARALERIGDRCQNICEYIIYFVKGKDVRHIARADFEMDIKGQ